MIIDIYLFIINIVNKVNDRSLIYSCVGVSVCTYSVKYSNNTCLQIYIAVEGLLLFSYCLDLLTSQNGEINKFLFTDLHGFICKSGHR